VSVAQQFRVSVAPLTRTWIDPRVVAVAAIISFLAKPANAGPELAVYSYQAALLKVASENEGQAVDSLRLDRLARALREGRC
jgi:hypothetical protein